MARNIEKLLKIESPKEVSKLTLEPIEGIPTTPTLDLVDIEPRTEPKINVHIDLGLDQLEEPED